MKPKHRESRLIILLATLFLLAFSVPAMAAVKASFLYSLSDFTGFIPYNWARVSVDEERNEVYVLYQSFMRIFNEAGMEIHRFGDDLDLGRVIDLAIEPSGDILLLAYDESGGEIIRCNYRGDPKSTFWLSNLPDEFSKFGPNRMIYRQGNLYFISSMGMKIVITDNQGNFKKGYDLIPLLEREEKERGNMEVNGFSVDREGNILFTVSTLFRACILSPEGKIEWFGRPGSIPGKFNIVAGITKDSIGNYLVVDKLKCAVMVFDKDFKFITQFGYRGLKPDNLIIPNDIVIDNKGRIYVTQTKKRGVSVFKLNYN
jgi:sugar lactone lactonase YvrE